MIDIFSHSTLEACASLCKLVLQSAVCSLLLQGVTCFVQFAFHFSCVFSELCKLKFRMVDNTQALMHIMKLNQMNWPMT
jgi:hypothetical protein